MKYTIKHGLITCLGLAILAILLPWFTAVSAFHISGMQLGCVWACALGALPDFSAIYSAVSGLGGLISSAAATPTFWQWFLIFLALVALLAPFVLTVVSLFMSIFSNSKKSSVAMLVMQAVNSVIALVYIILLLRAVNTVNNVTQLSMGAGSYLYLAASVAGLIVSVLLVKRFVDGEGKDVAPASTGVVCVAGEYLGVALPLEKSSDVLVIGRDASVCNLVLTGAKISRKHCEISYNPIRGNYRVVDSSTNGTYIKGGVRLEKDRPMELAPGTVLYLGNEMNSFRLQ